MKKKNKETYNPVKNPFSNPGRLTNIKYYIAAAVALITFVVYFSCLHSEFVMWDDDCYIYKNPHIHTLNLSFFRWASSAFYCANWHPLTWFSHALDYAVWGLNPLGHHLTNNILHAANTFIVVIVVAKLLEAWQHSRQQNPPLQKARNSKTTDSSSLEGSYLVAAAVTGLLFGLHPLHVESVAWVSERKDLLCAMFFLLSILAYTKYVSVAKEGDYPGAFLNRHYLLVAGLSALALLSKPMAVTLPGVFLILDCCPFNRIRSMKTFLSALLEKLPLIALSIISSVLTVLAQKAGGALQTFEIIPLSPRMLVAAESLLSYLWKMVLPVNLIPYYPYPRNISLFSAEYFLSVILVSGITAACIVMMKKQRLWLAVWGYYVLTLLPVLGIVQVGGQAMADRYTYLPSLGPFIVAGLLAAWLWKKSYLRKGAGAGLVIAAAILIAGPLSFLTYKQIAVWKNSLNLWSYIAGKEPEDAPLAHYNLGIVYRHLNMPDKAIEQYLTAIRLRPGYAEAHNNLGFVYKSLNMPDKAEEEFLTAVSLKPDNIEAHTNLGVLYQARNMPDKAEKEFLTVIRLKPDNAGAHFNLGVFYNSGNMPDKAEEEFLAAVRLQPDFAEAHFYLGYVYYKMGQMERARSELARGLEIRPDNQQARQLLEEITKRLRVND
ncbi:MAG: tetratricopeptide repeat protein [Nitrospirae bacterium]|nr:tetratricopeptide repeat protein [Nitrospirota bacterium]